MLTTPAPDASTMWLAFLLMFVPIVLFAFGFTWLLGKRFTLEQLERGWTWGAEFPGPILESLGDRLTRRAAGVSGPEALVSESATVLSSNGGTLWVQLSGERWRAECAEPVSVGARVRVLEVRDLTLVVEFEIA